MPTTMPTWDQFMVPVLQVMADGNPRKLRELRDAVAEALGLDDTQLAEESVSGYSVATNRIGWAASYLTRVDALARPARGLYVITDVGRQMLRDNPNGVTERGLRTYARPDDQWWVVKRQVQTMIVEASVDDPTMAPFDQIDAGITRINAEVSAHLLTRMHGNDPVFFEKTVVKLLVAMGYGGADGHARVTSRSNDGGIDGIIDQDTLGLNRVYVQAKRYAPDTAVQRPELQAFVGALSGKADGGVFITTGRFSKGAREYADTAHSRIILIDGQRLTALMITFGVGVQVKQTVQIVEIDEDFFE